MNKYKRTSLVDKKECHICDGQGALIYGMGHGEVGERDCEACYGTGYVDKNTNKNTDEWDLSLDNPENWDEDMYGDRALQER